MATAGTLIGYAQNQLGFDRSDIGIPGLEETQLLAVCNQAVIEYFEAHRRGGGEPPVNFQKEHGAELTSDTALGEDVTSATTDFDVDDSSDFPTSGVLAIWDDEVPDYVAFTGNSSDNFTGVTGIGYNHSDGATVARLYPLPSDFSDFRSDVHSPDGVRVDGVPYTHSSAPPVGLHFYLYDDGTTKYLHLPEGLTGGLSVRYNAEPTTIDDVDDTVDIPTKDEWFAVWRIVMHAAPILKKFDEFNIAQNRAQQILSNALITRNIGKRSKVRAMGRMFSYGRNNPNYR